MRTTIIAILIPITFAVEQGNANSASSPESLIVASPSHFHRNLAIGNILCGSATYFYFVETWGVPNGRFHFKKDLDDNLNLTDEVSHFFAGYKLTQGFTWLFHSLNVPQEKATVYGALEAALVTTLIEFPMDAFNPDQGFGTSDLIFNYGGIGWGLIKGRYPNNFDMKVSVKRPTWDYDHKFLASSAAEFDNFIWWANWKPKYIWTGIGYSTNHDHGTVESETYLGIGTTLYDLLALTGWRDADKLRALDSYFLNLKVKL